MSLTQLTHAWNSLAQSLSGAEDLGEKISQEDCPPSLIAVDGAAESSQHLSRFRNSVLSDRPYAGLRLEKIVRCPELTVMFSRIFPRIPNSGSGLACGLPNLSP